MPTFLLCSNQPCLKGRLGCGGNGSAHRRHGLLWYQYTKKMGKCSGRMRNWAVAFAYLGWGLKKKTGHLRVGNPICEMYAVC